MTDDLLTALAAARDPTEKAALIAEFTLADLPADVTTVARRAVILHWFNSEVLAALLPAENATPAAEIYELLADLPFIEQLPQGLAFHEQTRSGLLARYSASQPDLLREAAALAAPVYAAAEDKSVTLEGLYCHTLAGNETEATNLLEALIFWAGAREDWPMLLNIFELRDEAESYGFVEALPRTPLYYFTTGLAHQSLQDYEAALADYSRAIALNPEHASAFYNRGLTYYALQDYEAALADYSRAIALNPEVASAYNNRGITYKNLQDYEAALADYSRAIALKPEDASAFYNRGLTYKNLQDYEAALADFSRAIALNPEYASAYNNRGNTYYALQDYEAALADYSRAIALNPEDASAFYNTACVYALQDKIEAALPPLRRALELEREKFLALIPGDSDFDTVREDVRFRALVAEFQTGLEVKTADQGSPAESKSSNANEALPNRQEGASDE